jgi:sugar O-acyltransferase (sialic acid O-acetyltransferase NeuD family)
VKQLLIIGAGGHGRVVADIAKLSGWYQRIVFADDANIQESGGYPVVCKTKEAVHLLVDYEVVVAIGNNQTRKRILENLEAHSGHLTALVHPSAVIASDVVLGAGSVVMANAVINCGSKIGKGVIVNTAATIDHDNQIGDFVHISPGAHLAGTVAIGDETWIGIGASISNNLNICDGCLVGAGAVVIRDIEKVGTYVGVPAREKGLLWESQ